MLYKITTLLLCLSSLWILNGMEDPYQNFPIQVVTTPIIYTTSEDDLNKKFSRDYLQLKKGVFSLTKLAKKGDIPSKYLLFRHYESKNYQGLTQQECKDLSRNKFITRVWFIDAVINNYPLAQFDFGKKVFENSLKFQKDITYKNILMKQGLGYIFAAANGILIPGKFQNNEDPVNLFYCHLPAVKYLADLHNDTNLGFYWKELEAYLKALGKDK